MTIITILYVNSLGDMDKQYWYDHKNNKPAYNEWNAKINHNLVDISISIMIVNPNQIQFPKYSQNTKKTQPTD